MTETWKTIQWRGNIYPNHLVSINGKVVTRNITSTNKHKLPLFGDWREISFKKQNKGYVSCFITPPNGKRTYPNLHQLVWESFNGEIPEGFVIDHIDNNPKNNHLSNLQIVTRQQNTLKWHRVDKLKK